MTPAILLYMHSPAYQLLGYENLELEQETAHCAGTPPEENLPVLLVTIAVTFSPSLV